MTAGGEVIVRVADVHAGYTPGVDILRGLTLEARANAITLVIGPNGAGKSTMLRTVFGFLTPGAGTVSFKGRDTKGLRPSDLKLAGISYVTQDINSFPHLTVEENLMMGAWVFRRDKARLARQLERVYATFPALTVKRGDRAGSLSGGQGRMLSVAREMMTDPVLLLIDEPTVGLAPNLVEQVYEILMTARKATGAAILLVEQNVEQALPLADHLYLLNLGQVKAEGPGREFDDVRVRALVRECLLG
ncbi:MAG: ABC transporter ATP-binding protein [Alphaproteobacteria bacterium]|nr:ABC transporter ATP-binding protein [Alphaproteobacteria bacterium]